MMPYSTVEAWAAVVLAFLGTFIWRFAGVLLAERITPDGPLMHWINAVAYSMVAGVMMLILVFPDGVLGTTQLNHRLLGFGVGVTLILVTKKLWIAIIGAISTFAFVVSFFGF